MKKKRILVAVVILAVLFAIRLGQVRPSLPAPARSPVASRITKLNTERAVPETPRLPANVANVADPAHNINPARSPAALSKRDPRKNGPPKGPSLAAQATGDGNLSEAALQQIRALQQEKAGRTAVQQKISSKLLDATKMQQGQPIAEGIPTLRVNLQSDTAGRVLVDIKARVSDNLLADIATLDGKVVNSFAAYQAVRAWMPLNQMESLGARDDVTFIRPAVKASYNTGSVDSEGDTTHRAIGARATYGVSGAGVKVGVLSDSVDNLSSAQLTGDLGTVTVLPGQDGVDGTGTGEGTAMLEIIHDLAPGAQLFFATANPSPAQFASNILALRAQGCDIIVDDAYYFNESPFQDDIIAQAVDTVTASGGLYFSAAGNQGNLDQGTSGTWEGDFVDSGTNSLFQGHVHSFGAVSYNTVTQLGENPDVDLFWADPLGAATNDYDLYLLDASGTVVVARADDRQTGTQDPYEHIDGAQMDVEERVVVVRYSGASRFLHLDVGGCYLAIGTAGSTHGHSCAANAFGVAATDIHNSYPQAFSGGSNNPVEFFSSDGPRRVFFNLDGSAITPGNFSSSGGTVRQKPDITAADGVSTSLSQFDPFYGTSAAAPHAAAIAALVKSSNPGLTTSQIRAALTSSALDIEALGWDRDSGYGIVMADLSLAAVPRVQQVDHFTWGPISSPQAVSASFPAVLTALDATNGIVTNFTGTTSLSGLAPGGLATNDLPGPLTANGSGSGASYTDGYSFTPNADLSVTHVRSYYGTKVSIWTDTGTLLASQKVTSVSTTWVETALSTPITLSNSVPYRVGVTYPAGTTFYYTTTVNLLFANGTNGFSYFANGDAFPNIQVLDTLQCLVGLRYTAPAFLPVTISPVVSGSFVNGSWTGSVAVLQTETNMFLKADDGSGHVGSSGFFTVVGAAPPPPPPPIFQVDSLQHFSSGQFQFTLSGTAGDTYEIQVSTDLQTWQTLTDVSLSGATTNILDTATNFQSRFYRAKFVGP